MGEPPVGSCPSAQSHDRHSVGWKAQARRLRTLFQTRLPSVPAPEGARLFGETRFTSPQKLALQASLRFPSILFHGCVNFGSETKRVEDAGGFKSEIAGLSRAHHAFTSGSFMPFPFRRQESGVGKLANGRGGDLLSFGC